LIGLHEASGERSPTTRIYPGLSHTLSPQTDIFDPNDADLQVEPIAAIGEWLVEALNGQS
jgi:hypothetical protein